MRRSALIVTLALMLAAPAAWGAGAKPDTEEQKTLYAMGVMLARNLESFRLTPAEFDFVEAGMSDAILGKNKQVDPAQYGGKIQELQRQRMAVVAEGEKKSGESFLAKAANEKGAKKTGSGLVYTEVKAGRGDTPKETDKVKVHYTGALTDGTVFDSSVQRGEPATFPLKGVIPCWTEGLQLMKVGGKAKLVCPSSIAYGDQGRPPTIKPGATLVFDVELLEIVKQ